MNLTVETLKVVSTPGDIYHCTLYSVRGLRHEELDRPRHVPVTGPALRDHHMVPGDAPARLQTHATNRNCQHQTSFHNVRFRVAGIAYEVVTPKEPL